MIDKLKNRIIELVGSWNDLYEEYYSHDNAEMWKYDYPLTKYGKEKWPLCEIGDNSTESYEKALKMLIDKLEDLDQKGMLILDRTRPIWETLDDVSKRFFENLYVQHREIAMWSYPLLYSGKHTPTDVINMTCKKLVERDLTVKMARENMFHLPF
jgi:hypothetical protein